MYSFGVLQILRAKALNRPNSPLLHDYKHVDTRESGSSKAPLWFGVGLVLPLAVVFFVSIVSEDADVPAVRGAETVSGPVAEPLDDASDAIPEAAVVDTGQEPAPTLASPPPVGETSAPEPDYDELTLTIRRGDTLDGLFRKNGLSSSHLVQMANLNEAGRYFRTLKPGDEFEIRHEDGKVVSLYSKIDLTSGLRVLRTDEGFVEEIVDHPVEKRTRIVYGMINDSLYLSGRDAGLSDNVIMDLAGIFGWDIDFVYDIRAGDNFYVQYEEIWQDGEFVKDGDILAAEFNNRDRSLRAVRYVYEDGREEYFTPEGRSVRKAFLRAPVDARVSSPFNPRRLHPVLKTVRPHRGIDYGAPSGTPIKAAGDGKVIFRGKQRGYGNVVILQHGGNIETLYAHMSRFQRGVGVGSRVRQGQIIGYVGATGMVTGAHLHYEFKLNGVHRNPRTVPLPQAEPINSSERDKFLAASAPVLEALDDFKQTRLATVALRDD